MADYTVAHICPWPKQSQSDLTMLCRHSVWVYQEDDLTCSSSGSTHPHLSQVSEPLWIDPGLQSGTGVRKLISTLKKKKKRKQNTGGKCFIKPCPKILACEEKATTTTITTTTTTYRTVSDVLCYRCATFDIATLPQGCMMVADPADSCCQTPSCPDPTNQGHQITNITQIQQLYPIVGSFTGGTSGFRPGYIPQGTYGRIDGSRSKSAVYCCLLWLLIAEATSPYWRHGSSEGAAAVMVNIGNIKNLNAWFLLLRSTVEVWCVAAVQI